jgi:hypothetical protein
MASLETILVKGVESNKKKLIVTSFVHLRQALENLLLYS